MHAQTRIHHRAGVGAQAALPQYVEAAQNPERAAASLRENLGKLGTTLYEAVEIALPEPVPFIPASAANALRRAAVEVLDAARAAAYRRPPRAAAARAWSAALSCSTACTLAFFASGRAKVPTPLKTRRKRSGRCHAAMKAQMPPLLLPQMAASTTPGPQL